MDKTHKSTQNKLRMLNSPSKLHSHIHPFDFNSHLCDSFVIDRKGYASKWQSYQKLDCINKEWSLCFTSTLKKIANKPWIKAQNPFGGPTNKITQKTLTRLASSQKLSPFVSLSFSSCTFPRSCACGVESLRWPVVIYFYYIPTDPLGKAVPNIWKDSLRILEIKSKIPVH